MKNVVSFARSDSYIMDKFRQNCSDRRYLDALDLVRQVTHRASASTDNKLEEAWTLLYLGQYELAACIATELLSSKDARREALMLLSMCRRFMNDQDGCFGLAVILAREYPEIAGDQGYLVIAEAVDHFRRQLMRLSRRERRYYALKRRALSLYMSGRHRTLMRILERSVGADCSDACLLEILALLLFREGRKVSATLASGAADRCEKDDAARCFEAIRLSEAGDAKGARKILEDIDITDRLGGMEEILFEALSVTGDDRYIRRRLDHLFRKHPYDKHVIHMLAVNSLRLTGSAEHAKKYWTRILRIDPEDSAAAFRLQQAANKTLPAAIGYGFSLPDEEAARRVNAMLAASLMSRDELERYHARNVSLMTLCRWGIRGALPEARYLALKILGDLDGEDAKALLSEYHYVWQRRERTGLRLISADGMSFDEYGCPIKLPPKSMAEMRRAVTRAADLSGAEAFRLNERMFDSLSGSDSVDKRPRYTDMAYDFYKNSRKRWDIDTVARCFGVSPRALMRREAASEAGADDRF